MKLPAIVISAAIIAISTGVSASSLMVPGQVETDNSMRYVNDSERLQKLKKTPRYRDAITGRYYYVEGRTGDMFWSDGTPKLYLP